MKQPDPELSLNIKDTDFLLRLITKHFRGDEIEVGYRVIQKLEFYIGVNLKIDLDIQTLEIINVALKNMTIKVRMQ